MRGCICHHKSNTISCSKHIPGLHKYNILWGMHRYIVLSYVYICHHMSVSLHDLCIDLLHKQRILQDISHCIVLTFEYICPHRYGILFDSIQCLSSIHLTHRQKILVGMFCYIAYSCESFFR